MPPADLLQARDGSLRSRPCAVRGSAVLPRVGNVAEAPEELRNGRVDMSDATRPGNTSTGWPSPFGALASSGCAASVAPYSHGARHSSARRTQPRRAQHPVLVPVMRVVHVAPHPLLFISVFRRPRTGVTVRRRRPGAPLRWRRQPHAAPRARPRAPARSCARSAPRRARRPARNRACRSS